MSFWSGFEDLLKKYPAFPVIVMAMIGMFTSLYILSYNINPDPNPKKTKYITKELENYTIVYDTITVERRYFSDTNPTFKKIPKRDQWSTSEVFFNKNSSYLVWIILVSLMTGFSSAFIPLLIYRVYIDDSVCKHKKYEKIIIVLVSLCLAILLPFFSGDSPFLKSALEIIDSFQILMINTSIVNGLIIYNTLIGAIAIGGQILVGFSTHQLGKKNEPITLVLHVFNQYRESLKFYLGFLGGMISFTVVTTSFLRKLLLAEIDSGDFEVFPLDFVVVYGLIFTVFLAIFYLPVYYQLRIKGENLKKQFQEQRDQLNNDQEGMLDKFVFSENGISNFKVALSILSPIITTLFAEMINFV